MESFYLVSILILPLVLAIKLVIDTRGCTYFTGHNTTDNEKMVRMAQEIKFWNWPSRMHNIKYGRGQLREYWVLALKLLNMIVRKPSDHLNIILALLANYVSSVLIYFIVSGYFSPAVGFVTALLYITSFWPFHVAVYMGHIHLAQAFFFVSVYMLQLTEAAAMPLKLWLFLAAGIFCAVSFASSSASRKYPPVVFVALLYSLRGYLTVPWHEYSWMTNMTAWVVFGGLMLAFVAAWLAAIKGKGLFLPLLRKLSRRTLAEEKYFKLIKSLFGFAAKIVVLGGAVAVFWVNDNLFYASAGMFVLGLFLVFMHLMLPVSSFMSNLVRYSSFLNIGTWANHFRCYHDQPAVFGKQLPENFRGEGLPWIPRFFWRVMPVIEVLYVISLIAVGAYYFAGAGPLGDYVWLVFVSLLPIVVVEASKGLQVGKSYMPSIIGLLLMIAAFLQFTLGHVSPQIWWTLALGVVVGQFALSVYVFYTDVLPNRLAPTVLRNSLKKLGIAEFYTYDNVYNQVLVDTMLYSYPNEFKVHRINSLTEAGNGYIVVPGTSSKSVQMETQRFAIENGDFTADPALNQLYAGLKIEKLALAGIKTMGSSKIHVHESEITSYRDLILKQITNHDRWLAQAWVIKGGAL